MARSRRKQDTTTYNWSVVLNTEKLRQGLDRVQETQKTWRDAIRLAEYWNNPLRYQLYRIYKDVTLYDSHLISLIQNRKKRLKQLEFELYDKNGVSLPEETKKLKTRWFSDLIDIFIDTYFWGHSLVLIDSVTDNWIDGITLIDREYVSPETGLILESYTSLHSGFDFRNPKDKNYDFLIEIGKRNDLGLLSSLSTLALFKKSDVQFWNLFIEMYGVPYRIGKIKSDDVDSKQNMYSHLKNMGTGGFAIITGNDEIETINNSSATSPEVFTEMIKYANSEMSKLVLGASGITDGLQSGTQAQSNVHQLQLDVITKADVMDFEYFFNEYLIEKLVKINLFNSDYTLKFKSPERVAQQFLQAELDGKIKELALSNVFDVEYLKEVYGFVPNMNYFKVNEQV